ncbi:MAG: ThuA domain-containing protein [Planctomycetota bacterium]|nr:ThuA domain-containing protein [Planctomycetota bacterium]
MSIATRFTVSLAFALTMASGTMSGRQVMAEESAKSGARILMVTQSGGFKHGSVSRKANQLAPAEQAMTELGIKSNVFRVDCSQDAANELTKDLLQGYDIVMFYTTGTTAQLKMDPAVRDYLFTQWVKQKGHGFIGTHSAADTYGDYEPYWEMLGGTFDGHPWGSGETVTITVHDPLHPASRPWGSEFEIRDEIYKFKHLQPEKVRVLMSLDMAKTAHKEAFHVPILWVKQYGEGRVMHMSLGHNETVWANPTYMQSLLGGIKWILGQEPGDATPNPELSAAEDAKAKAAAAKK